MVQSVILVWDVTMVADVGS